MRGFFSPAEGDLWRTSVADGAATRLTTHPSSETQAALSRDGAQEAYVMPVAGGLPRRVTFEDGGVNVLRWTMPAAPST